MQLQYIGARYIPIFYQNSVDQTANWEINVEYEPLTFVTTQNNHLYLSKKTVPDNIGTPAQNTEYWLDMGIFTDAQIAEVVERVDALEEEYGTLTETTIPEITQAIETLTGTVGEHTEAIEDIEEELSKIPIPYVTPELYGAVGDGATDDYTAIYNALTSGKDVVLKPNTSYYIDRTIAISDVNIYGDNSTLIFDANSNVDGPSMRINKVNIDGVTFKHINGSADNTNQCLVISGSSHISNCIFIDISSSAIYNTASDLLVENCTFNQCGYFGTSNFRASIYNAGAIDNIRIINCIFNEVNRAIIFRGGEMNDNNWLTNALVYGCRINGAGNMFQASDTLGIGSAKVRKLKIENNYISNFYSNLTDSHKFDYLIITGNIFEGGSGDGVFVGDESYTNCIITNNIFRLNNTGIRATATIGGALCYRTIIANNTFDSCATNSIIVSATINNAYIREVLIANNTFYASNCDINIDADTARAKNVQRVKIANNQFYRSYYNGIKIRYGQFIFINDNTFEECCWQHESSNYMVAIENTDHIRFDNNSFLQGALACISIASTVSTTRLVNNTYRGVTAWLSNNGTATVELNNINW